MPGIDAEVVHRSLDGRRFALGGPLDLGRPATSVLDVIVRGRLQEFTAGAAGLGDEVAAALGARDFDEEFSYGGGTLLVGRSRPYDLQTRLVEDLMVAVWLGGGHCLVTQLYGTTTAELLGLLRTVRIGVHDDGLSLAPASGADSAPARPATVVKEVPGLGLLELSPLTDEHRRTLPAWSGRMTAAGELFADTMADGKPYYVLTTTDLWTTVMPLDDVGPGEMADRIGQLRVGATT